MAKPKVAKPREMTADEKDKYENWLAGEGSTESYRLSESTLEAVFQVNPKAVLLLVPKVLRGKKRQEKRGVRQVEIPSNESPAQRAVRHLAAQKFREECRQSEE